MSSIAAQFLDRPIAFNRAFVSLGVGINGALLLSQAVYWSKRTSRSDGWFYKTQAEWEDETGLTRYEQEGARKKLRNLGILHEEKRGVPCKTYYRIDFEMLNMLLFQYVENQQTGMRETSEQEGGLSAGCAGENQQTITESTQRLPETTTDTLGASAPKAKKKNQYPEWFENLWKVYPERSGSNPKNKALSACNARIAEGVVIDDILAGVKRYKAYCAAKGMIGTEFVMQAVRFFGTNREFEHPWDPPSGPGGGYMRKETKDVDYHEGVGKDGRF